MVCCACMLYYFLKSKYQSNLHVHLTNIPSSSRIFLCMHGCTWTYAQTSNTYTNEIRLSRVRESKRAAGKVDRWRNRVQTASTNSPPPPAQTSPPQTAPENTVRCASYPIMYDDDDDDDDTSFMPHAASAPTIIQSTKNIQTHNLCSCSESD
jgi:hypothetical protein